MSVIAVNSVWVGGSTGSWTDSANWSAGIPQALGDTATLSTPVSISVPTSVMLKTLTVNAPATVTVAAGATLVLTNAGGDVLIANADVLVTGSGNLWFSMSGTTGTDYANIRPAIGKTVTLDACITGMGIENNGNGTLRLTNANNAYTGATTLTQSSGVLSFSSAAALGSGTTLLWGQSAYYASFRYTGGSTTLAQNLSVGTGSSTGRDIVFQHAGTGALTLNGSVFSAFNTAKAITFDTPNANASIVVNGSISNGVGILYLYDSGAGTLVLNGPLSYSGESRVQANRTINGDASAAAGLTTVAQNGRLTVGSTGIVGGPITLTGGTLAAESGATFRGGVLTCNAGSTVVLNPSAANNFSLTLPPTNMVNGAGVRLEIPSATTASTVTLPLLLRTDGATLNIIAPNIGTARNTLFIQNFSAGTLPAWLTVNGLCAAYDAALGVIPASAPGSAQSLTALGPSTVPNDATAAVAIDAAGTAGGISIAANPTTVFSLTQTHPDNPAVVDLGGQTLAATLVALASNGNHLTLTNGTLTGPSSASAPADPATFPRLTTAPIVWFDLSDTATVTTDTVGRISLLANKGSLGTALNAVVPSGSLGPRYVPNAVAGLGVARTDGIQPPQGLATLGNPGIATNAPRTVFAVTLRSPTTQNALYSFYLGADSDSNQAFAVVERIDRTSFVTMANDLESSTASPAGHNVFTFITGLSGTRNAGQGFRNGASIGTKTFALATVDAPIYLLNRPAAARAFSGPGELAEALVFDYTLSDTDRAAVETYLMTKWHIAASRQETLLALKNESSSSALAVPATVAESYGAALALAKSGTGDVVLGGALAYSGATLVQEGALTFDTPTGLTNVLSGYVTGSGSLTKRGTGSLVLAKVNTYAGGTTVQAGTLYPGANGSLGTGPVAVQNGAALDIANAAINSGAAFANAVSIQGAGPDGLGALRNSHPRNDQPNALQSVTLTADAAAYARSRLDVRGGLFDFGGHSLTVNGGSRFSIASSVVSNVAADTAIRIASGEMNFDAVDAVGSSANTVSADAGAGVNLLSMAAPLSWSLGLANNAYLRAGNGGTDTHLNCWAGPITLASGTARFSADDGGSAAVTGAINGDGGLLKEGPGWFWLLNPGNAYAGATAVTQGTLYAVSPGSLGTRTASALTVSGTGTFIARTASTAFLNGWTVSDIGSIASASVFTTPGTTALGIDTPDEDFGVTANLPYVGLKKLGPRKLTLTGTAPNLGTLAVYDGELDLSETGGHNLHGNSVAVGVSTNMGTFSVLRLAGSTLITDDPGYNRAGPTLAIGSATNSRSVFFIGSGAAANGRLTVGNDSGAAGAVYQAGGTVTNTGGVANDAALGANGFGYYRLDSGEFASKGSSQLGRNSGSTGIFEQRGGTCVINPGAAPSDGIVGDYYNGSFTTRKGVGIFLLSGGTFNLNGHSFQLGEWASAGDYNDGYGALTLENDAQASLSYIALANRNGSPQGYVNLNGGSLTAGYFQKGGNNSSGNSAIAAIGFNGGVLHVPSTGSTTSALVRTGIYNTPILLNVYSGGAVIDTLDSANVTLDQPLRAPANFGVASVAITSAGAGYIAPPAVTFSGGNGTGATAVAEIDLSAGTVTAVRVTSPGIGYTAAPTVTLRGGGCTTLAAASAALSTTTSGGLLKLGPGSLTLTTAGTYTGPTVVSNGLLRLSSGNQALSAASAITLANGTLDLSGGTLTNNNPVVIANGRLVNGSISAPSFVKTGSGSATLGATPKHASDTALFETYVRTLGPIVWYDPSDAATVTLDASGRITALLNKGSKSSMDATSGYVYTGTVALGAPLLATGTLSYAVSGLPMIKIDGNDRGLASGSNLGITGAVARTVVAVVTRDSTATSAFVCFGAPNSGQMFEVGDRMDASKVVIGGFGGYDLTMSPVNPTQQVNVVVGSLTSPKVTEAWRTGLAPNHASFTASANFNTADSRFLIGQRAGASKGAETRGEIGEVFVFDRVLSDSERTELQRLLVKKWMTVPSGNTDAATVPVSVAQGTLRLIQGTGVVTRLAPIVWYDPSDAASVTLDANGRVTGLRNKGSRPGMDAITGISNGGTTLLAPLFATGALSYAASSLPMIGIDSNNCGLASGANTGISGSSARTVAGIFARDNTTAAGPITAFGNPATAQLYEVGDRQNGTAIGCYGTGNDFIVTLLNPVQQANVYIAANTSTNVNALWRTGFEPSSSAFTLANTLATADSRFFIGQRPNTANRADFRGQIGEVLVFNRLLTDTERSDLKDYLASKWTQTSGTNNLFDGTSFDIAAGAALDLGGARANITISGIGTVTNGTLGAGTVVSPAGDGAVGELDLGSVAFAAGSQYRLTLSGNLCDHVLVNGDLSGLTVVPATDAAITGHTFVIATGSITAKPALSGFPSKFKLVRLGSDLLLTSTGGTTLLVK